MSLARKGIMLAGGSGTRLHPVTYAISKQLLPIYDKPMVYYPLSALMLAGIRDILVISTPEDLPRVPAAARRRQQWGLSLELRRAARARRAGAGVHHRTRLHRPRSPVALVLGDNMFYGHGLPDQLRRRRAAHRGRDRVRLSRQGSAALRRGAIRRGRAARSASRRSRRSPSPTTP